MLEEFRNGTKQQADVMPKLEAVMKKRLEKSRDGQYKKFVIPVSTKSITEYAAHVLVKGINNFYEDYKTQGITEQEAASAKGVLAWAKNHYKSQPGEERLKILKKAYALEYAQNTLNDLLADGVDADKNTALKLLDSDYIGEIYKEPKVYISKGIAGSLRSEQEDMANGDKKTTLYVDIVAEKNAKVLYDLTKKARGKIEDVAGIRLYNAVGKKEQKTDDGSKELLMSDIPAGSKGASTDAKKRKKFAEKIAKVLEASRKLKGHKKAA
ncbi:MAG: hypothetical protein KDD04_03625 [Sinomicrobium sp.]|nr:hypothetical protein [Sinomicrobium sp.]